MDTVYCKNDIKVPKTASIIHWTFALTNAVPFYNNTVIIFLYFNKQQQSKNIPQPMKILHKRKFLLSCSRGKIVTSSFRPSQHLNVSQRPQKLAEIPKSISTEHCITQRTFKRNLHKVSSCSKFLNGSESTSLFYKSEQRCCVWTV